MTHSFRATCKRRLINCNYFPNVSRLKNTQGLKWKWHRSVSSPLCLPSPAVFVVVTFSPISRLVLPQARQLILQHGLSLSDLDRHPEVWWAPYKCIWKPWKWGRATICWCSNPVSLNWERCGENARANHKETWTAELTVAISKCREGFKSLFVAPFALLSACVMSRVVFDFPPTQLDVAIDGADEVDADLTLIKGGGWVQINTDSRTLTVSPLISVSRSSSLCLTAAAWLRRRL